jgi:glycosyltransferase involved in cell wall biosynthesis
MARIGIDASILLHGMRAGRRHSRNLLKHLMDSCHEDEWRLLYFDRKGNTPGKFSHSFSRNSREVITRTPMRFMLPSWRAFGYPSVEGWLGSIDVLYAPDLYFPPAKRAPVLCTIRGVAYLAIPHLLQPHTVRNLTRAFAYARKRASHFLAVSESTRRDLLHLTDLPPDRIHVVTHGVDPVFRRQDSDTCHASIKRKFGVGRPFLLYVGVIGRHKNVMGILQAYHAAGLHRQGIDLIMAGPFESEIGPARSFVLQSGIDKFVHFTGNVTQEDNTLVELYNAALALVHPSFYEGWGTTPLEAMACGTPVVTSDVPSVREVVKDSALLVPPDDIDALKIAMLEVAGDETSRTELASKGLKHVAQHTWERAAKRLRQIIARVQEEGL